MSTIILYKLKKFFFVQYGNGVMPHSVGVCTDESPFVFNLIIVRWVRAVRVAWGIA